jgi:hypothetical protein
MSELIFLLLTFSGIVFITVGISKEDYYSAITYMIVGGVLCSIGTLFHKPLPIANIDAIAIALMVSIQIVIIGILAIKYKRHMPYHGIILMVVCLGLFMATKHAPADESTVPNFLQLSSLVSRMTVVSGIVILLTAITIFLFCWLEAMYDQTRMTLKIYAIGLVMLSILIMVPTYPAEVIKLTLSVAFTYQTFHTLLANEEVIPTRITRAFVQGLQFVLSITTIVLAFRMFAIGYF